MNWFTSRKIKIHQAEQVEADVAKLDPPVRNLLSTHQFWVI